MSGVGLFVECMEMKLVNVDHHDMFDASPLCVHKMNTTRKGNNQKNSQALHQWDYPG